MSSLTGTLLVAGHSFRRSVGSGRFIALAFLCCLPVLISLVAPHGGLRLFMVSSMIVVFQLVVPLLGLILGVAVLDDEIEGRTVTYLFTRPLPRPFVYLGRLFGIFAAYAPLPAVALMVSRAAARGREIELVSTNLLPYGLLAAAALLVYMAIFAAFRIFARRAFYIGFLVIGVEGFLSKLPDAQVAQMSIWFHTITVFHDVAGLTAGDSVRMARHVLVDESGSAAMTLAGILVVALIVGIGAVRSREIRVPASVA